MGTRMGTRMALIREKEEEEEENEEQENEEQEGEEGETTSEKR